MKTTIEDFRKAIEENVYSSQVHVIGKDKAAKSCYALALKMAEDAFNAGREGLYPDGDEPIFKFKTFHNYKTKNQNGLHDKRIII